MSQRWLRRRACRERVGDLQLTPGRATRLTQLKRLAAGEPFPIPGLKHQHAPELHRRVPFAAQVFPPRLADGKRIVDALLSQHRWLEKILGPRAKRPAKPLVQGHTEAHLRPVEQVPRQIAREQRPKNPLSPILMDLELERKPPRELHEPIIKKRHAPLEAD